MNIDQAIFLGILQGATEFLPISSSGHLALAQFFLETEAGLAFDVALHLGTLLGILVYFRQDLLMLAGAVCRPFSLDREDRRLQKLAMAICLGTIPGVLAGLFLGELSESYLRHPATVACSLAGAAVFLLWADRVGRKSRDLPLLTTTDAIIVGISQALAIIPGFSRSGVTITAGLFLGFNRQTAVRFSFLLSAPIIFGAGVYKIPEIISQGLLTDQAPSYIAGFLASALSGYLFIAFLMRFVRARSFAIFAYYRFALAGLIWLLLLL